MNYFPFSDRDKEKLGKLLLETGTLLQSSGACTARIRMTIKRIAECYAYKSHLFITQQTLTLTLFNEQDEIIFTGLKRTEYAGINFNTLARISKMSWRIVHEKWGLEQIDEALKKIQVQFHYHKLISLIMVSLAGAAFCRIINGTLFAMLITFIATFVGLFVRQKAIELCFNQYLCVFFASLTAAFASRAFDKLFSADLTSALTACVLFLIPGVPLINAFTDLIDGNTLNGIARVTNVLIIAFMIALGVVSSLLIFH